MTFMKMLAAVLLVLFLASPVFAQMETGDSQWQLSLDVIKAKAQHLVQVNQQLVVENNDLGLVATKLKAVIDDLKLKNNSMDEFLKKRNGRTDQQAQLDDINATIKMHQDQLAQHQQQVEDVNRQVSDVQRKINIKRLRISDWEIRKKAKEVEAEYKKQMITSQVPTDFDIGALRKDVETQKTAEAALEAKINDFKRTSSTQKLDVSSLREENTHLQSQVETYQKEISFRRLHQAPAGSREKYNAMMGRKHELEAKIQLYEGRIDVLKNPANFTLSWDKEKKRLIHSMVQADAKNQQLKSRIDSLKEDIDILRDQVAKLERRINFGQGKGYDKGSKQ